MIVGIPKPDALRPPVDVDALAARMKSHQDVYRKIRDEALGAYALRHPGQHSYDDLAQMTLKLASYLWVWDDYYGEGLRQKLDNYCINLNRDGCTDPLWESFQSIDFFSNHYSNSDDGIEAVNRCANLLGQSQYPEAFKFESYRMCIGNMVAAKSDPSIKPPVQATSLPPFIDKATRSYRELINEHISDDLLYDKGNHLLSAAQNDDSSIQAVAAGISTAFQLQDPQNSTADLLNGLFYTDYAWTARGGGYADTVSSQGWQLFRSRLDQANQIVTDLYGKHPENTRIANVMMAIVLGRGGQRDDMEFWFEQGIQADPDNFQLYMQKRWYLLPRWHGSDPAVWNFGLQCAQSNNWSAKIPVMLAECVTDAAERDPRVYSQPEIWAPLEKMFRAYLDHYPESSHYRSYFAKMAVCGEHWDVAEEQFKILGDSWDPDVFPDNQYVKWRRLADAHAN